MSDVEELAAALEWGEERLLGAGEPALGTELDQALEEKGAAAGIEMGRHLVEEEDGQIAETTTAQAGLGQHDADEKGRLPASGAGGGGLARAVGGEEVAAVGAECRTAGLGIGGAGGGEALGQVLLGGKGWRGGEPGFDLALHGEPRAGEGGAGLGKGGVEVAHELIAGSGHGDPSLRQPALEGAEPCRVVPALAEQMGALAEQALVSRDAGGVPGVDREHEPVEETAAAGGTLLEQPVHRRCEPKQAQDVGKLVLAAEGRTVLLDEAALAVSLTRAGDVAQALAAGDTCLETPGTGTLPAIKLRKASAAQAAAGGQERNGFQEVGLAGTVLAHEDDGTGLDREAQAGVVAEITEGQTPDGEGGAVCGSRLRTSQGCRDHTRIGMST